MAQARIKMAENGRVVIPASLRAEVGLANGGDLVARVEDGVVILESFEHAIARVRVLVQQHAPAEGGSVVDELIAERRAEAEREDHE